MSRSLVGFGGSVSAGHSQTPRSRGVTVAMAVAVPSSASTSHRSPEPGGCEHPHQETFSSRLRRPFLCSRWLGQQRGLSMSGYSDSISELGWYRLPAPKSSWQLRNDQPWWPERRRGGLGWRQVEEEQEGWNTPKFTPLGPEVLKPGPGGAEPAPAPRPHAAGTASAPGRDPCRHPCPGLRRRLIPRGEKDVPGASQRSSSTRPGRAREQKSEREISPVVGDPCSCGPGAVGRGKSLFAWLQLSGIDEPGRRWLSAARPHCDRLSAAPGAAGDVSLPGTAPLRLVLLSKGAAPRQDAESPDKRRLEQCSVGSRWSWGTFPSHEFLAGGAEPEDFQPERDRGAAEQLTEGSAQLPSARCGTERRCSGRRFGIPGRG